MNNAYFDLLMWARGPGFDIALVDHGRRASCCGVVEIFVLGRKKDFAKPKGSPVAQGIKTIFTRSVAAQGHDERSPGHLYRPATSSTSASPSPSCSSAPISR